MEFGQEGVLGLVLRAPTCHNVLDSRCTVTVYSIVSCSHGIPRSSLTCIPVECLCECEGILGISGCFEIVARSCARYSFAPSLAPLQPSRAVTLGRVGDLLAVAGAHPTCGSVCLWVLAHDLARLGAAKECGSIWKITRREGAARLA